MSARACVDCGGSGETIVRGCSHQGNCPCGEDKAFPCPRCEGSKVEGCAFCGEPSVMVHPHIGDACQQCADRGDEGGCDSGAEPSDPWDSETNRMIAEHYRRAS